MSFKRINFNLELVLGRQFLADVISYRQDRLGSFSDILKNMMSMLSSDQRTKPVPEIVWAGIEDLKNIAGQNNDEKLTAFIVKNVHLLTENIPALIFLMQEDARFKSLDEDAWYIKTGKSGKRMLQKWIGRSWGQQIPLQNVVAYHLFDADDLFRQWVDEDERMLFRIVLELEQVLYKQAPGGTHDISASGLQQVLKVLINQMEERCSVLQLELDDARSKLKKTVLRAISKTGTLEKRAGFYSARRLRNKETKTYSNLNEYINDWQKVNACLLKKAANMYRFLAFSATIESYTDDFKTELTAYFDALIIHPSVQLQKKLINIRREIANHQNGVGEVINHQKARLTRQIKNHILEPVQKKLEEKSAEDIIQPFSEQLVQAASQTNEEAVLISKLEIAENPPELKARHIEWRLLVARGMKEEVISGLNTSHEALTQSLQELLSVLHEILEIVDINLGAAARLSADRQAKDNPLEIVDEALERAENKLDKNLQRFDEVRESLFSQLNKDRNAFISNMMGLLYRSDTKTLSLLDAKYKVGEATQSLGAQTRGRWNRLKDRLSVMRRFITQKAKYAYEQGRIFLGLQKEEVQEKKKADIVAFLNETQRRINELPYIYRQLFSVDELSDRRYYVGINENFATMRQAYERWKEGHLVNCAIVGEKGSGKSTYISLVKQELFVDADVWHINLNETCWSESAILELFNEQISNENIGSVDELIEYLKSRRQRIVILFEGIQNLYLRYLNGYKGIDRLIYLISETGEHVFWVATCSRYAWAFLDKAKELSDYFSHVVRADALDKRQIENIILNRHRSSGYELVFEPEERYARTKKYRKMEKDEEKAQEHLKEIFFEELTELAEGNASIAMIFWVRSIREFDDTHLYIAPLEAASLKMLDDLQPATLFVLAALVLHDMLKPGELSWVLNMQEKECTLMLNRLKAKGILVGTENGMILNHLMYRQTIRELKERNILHLG